MEKKFYMLCTRDTVGSNASFHCKDGCGYSTDIDRAHVYTLEEAQSAWEMGRDIDQPILAFWVDALADFHVDSQVIPHESVIQEGCEDYVGYLKGDWDGNDVFWITEGYRPVADFSLARRFSDPDFTLDNIVWLPYAMANDKKRRTFRLSNFDARSMVQGPGLRIPEWLKRQRRRRKEGSGKTRWNCPCCGKISWQHNPYDYDGCLDPGCSEHRW